MEKDPPIRNYIASEHFLYSALPNIKVYDKEHKLIGFMKVRFRTFYKKYNFIYRSEAADNIIFTLEKFKLPKRAFGYKVLDNSKKEVISIKHLGPRLFFRKSNFELSKKNETIGYIKENSSKIYIIKHSFLVIPLIGDFFYNLASFIPKSYLICRSFQETRTSRKVAKIKIFDNFVNVNLKLDLFNNLIADEELMAISAILEMIEVTSKR